MDEVMILNKKNFLVIGTAKSGIAAARYLLDHGAYVTITDIEKREKLNKNIIELEKNKNPVSYTHLLWLSFGKFKFNRSNRYQRKN